MRDRLLRYEVASLCELPDCMSNNSRKLHLTYDEVLSDSLCGSVIRVVHDDFGCLFAYTLHASGTDLSVSCSGTLHELTVQEISKELEKYGFIVTFSDRVSLDDMQFKLLCTANELNMNKIRIMYVDRKDLASCARLVAFDAQNLSSWLSNLKTCSFDEFCKALESGYAVNLTRAEGGLTPPHNWAFLEGKVLNIEDVLKFSR